MGKNADRVLCHAIDKLLPDEQLIQIPSLSVNFNHYSVQLHATGVSSAVLGGNGQGSQAGDEGVAWRSGKDKTDLNFTISRMFPENGGRIGTYFHLFPTYAQAKKVVWDAYDRDGFKVTDHFPAALVASKNESELQITLINGSIYQLIGTDKIDSIVGTNPAGCVFSEYALQNPRAWDLLTPILVENDGWAIFNTTPRGHNHAKRMFDAALNDPAWYCSLLTVNDTFKPDGARVVTDAQIDERRHGPQPMSEELIQQEFYCSFEGFQEGSYYVKQLRRAREDRRIIMCRGSRHFRCLRSGILASAMRRLSGSVRSWATTST